MLYRPGSSRLHRANPLTKLAFVGVAIAMLPAWGPGILFAAAALAAVAGLVSGLGRALILRLAVLLVPVGVALILVHGLLIERGGASPLGPVAYYPDGLLYGLRVLSRLTLLLSVTLLFVMTTRTADLARALDGARFPAAIAYLLTAPLALLDLLADEAKAIRESLQVRGLSARGGIVSRARVLVALCTPLVHGLIIDISARAQALDGRGFRAYPSRTLLTAPQDAPFEPALRWALLAFAVLNFAVALR